MSLTNDIINTLITDLLAEFSLENFIEIEYGQKFDEPTMDIRVWLGGEKYPDELNTTEMTPQGQMGAPSYELGGGMFWRRKFIVKCAFFIDNDDRKEAQIQATGYQTRIIKRIKALKVASNDTNESFIMAQPIKAFLSDVADGPFIWRGDVVFEALTYFN